MLSLGCFLNWPYANCEASLKYLELLFCTSSSHTDVMCSAHAMQEITRWTVSCQPFWNRMLFIGQNRLAIAVLFCFSCNALLIRNSWETEYAIKQNSALFTSSIFGFKYRIRMFEILIFEDSYLLLMRPSCSEKSPSDISDKRLYLQTT